jgi:hypothetical protein
VATGRIAVERALLISTISALNEAEVVKYEKDLVVYEKAKIAQSKRVNALVAKIAKAIVQCEVSDLRVSNDYRWVGGGRDNRVDYVSIQLDLDGLTADDLGGHFRSGDVSPPNDPREMGHGKYHEREQMLRTLALTTKDEVSLPIQWSEQYL